MEVLESADKEEATHNQLLSSSSLSLQVSNIISLDDLPNFTKLPLHKAENIISEPVCISTASATSNTEPEMLNLVGIDSNKSNECLVDGGSSVTILEPASGDMISETHTGAYGDVSTSADSSMSQEDEEIGNATEAFEESRDTQLLVIDGETEVDDLMMAACFANVK